MSPADEQVERLIERGARKALTDFFEVFGVDISTPEARKEFSRDVEFLRTARIGSGRFSMAAIGAAATGVATGMGYILWKGLIAIGLVVR